MSEDSSQQSDLDQAFLEYLNRIDQQGPVDLDQFLKEYPDLAEPLRTLIETESQIEQMAGPPVSNNVEDVSTISQVNAVREETVIIDGADASTVQDDAASSLIGKQLGDYEILDILGSGGMGVVYKARQIGMERLVALKMIRSGCLATETDVQRFYFEAQAAGKLKHHLIVKVYEVGEIEGHHFFSMEHIAGTTLSKYVREQKSSPHQIAEYMRQIAEAVHYAHQQGVLHRDLKPANILVDSLGRPRITDFGLAKDMTSAVELTASGSAVGTPNYMPPEQAQARRDEMTSRSDVYSLGAVLYALLTDRPPFRGESLLEVLNQVIEDEPIPPRQLNPQCPRDLEAICLKCLQKSPAQRYESANSLAEDLSRFLSGDRVFARRSRIYDRAWTWLRNIPLVSAAMGRKSSRATVWHVAFQWSVIVLLILLTGGFFLYPRWIEAQRLAVVDVSTATSSGSYEKFGQLLAEQLRTSTGREVRVHHSAGAVENHARLLKGDADLAFLQDNTLEDERLQVLAPLYQEPILILVRENSGVNSISDLAGKKVSLGESESGMRISSRKILRYFGLRETDLEVLADSIEKDRSLIDLFNDENLIAAIVTIKLDNPHLLNLLDSKGIRLLPYPKGMEIPGFSMIQLDAEGDLPAGSIPSGGMPVPTTIAILAVRRESPDEFVTDCLNALYGERGVANRGEKILTLDDAAEMPSLNYHRAAHEYFRLARQRKESP